MRRILYLYLPLLLLLACDKVPDNTFPEDIQGTWLLAEIEGDDVVNTNGKFVYQFFDNGIATSAFGEQVFDSVFWQHINNCSYEIDDYGLKLSYEGFSMEANIFRIDSKNMIYEISSLKTNDVDNDDEVGVMYKMNKLTTVYDLEGIWKGVEGGSVDTAIWKFQPDGSYSIIVSNDTSYGNYNVYGNFLATQMIGDSSYRCWELSTAGSLLKWSNVQDSVNTTVSMTKQ